MVNVNQLNVNCNLPATGEPMTEATPWNSSSSPNAFVSFSTPNISTAIIDRRAAKQAVKKEEERDAENLSCSEVQSEADFILVDLRREKEMNALGWCFMYTQLRTQQISHVRIPAK